MSLLPFNTGFNHVTGHELEPGLQVFAKLFFWPVEISNERLQSVQLPEEVLGRPRAVAAEQSQVSQWNHSVTINHSLSCMDGVSSCSLLTLFNLQQED